MRKDIKAGQLKPNQLFYYRGRKCRRLDRKGIIALADEDRDNDRKDRAFTLSFHDKVEIEERTKVTA
jgi:hypothetical protein